MAIKGFVMMIGLCAALALAGCGGAPTPNQPAGTTAAGGSQAPTAQTTAATANGATAAPTTAAVSAASPTGGTTPTPAATAKPTTAATTAAAVPSGPPSDIIVNAQRAVLNAKAYRARTTSVSAKGATTIRLIEYVQPDRVHIVPSSGSEIIGIKSQGTWTKANGVWTKSSSSTLTDTIFSFKDPKVLEEFTKSLIVDQAKLVGPDLIDGKPMLVYQYGILLKGLGLNGSDISGTYKIWIGATDGLIYKLDGEQDSAVTAGEKTKSTTIYEYDSSIKIEPPI